MTFETLFKAQVANFLALYGEAITYRPLNNGANDKSVTALVHRDRLDHETQEGDVYPYKTMEVELSARTDVEGQVTVTVWQEPGVTNGDAMVIDSEVWYVRKRLGGADVGWHRLLIANTLKAMIQEV